ncbi:MAG: LysM peptidoglycan-binding domain-containing protein [Victivallales bacterium]|nr:LysM peptidoglycan-binding domain-containing protein [Victivallales bacterium]
MKTLIHIFIITILFSVITACGLKSGDESSHPLFRRALKAQKNNEFKQAIKYFTRYLSLKPDSSKAHLRLASIYDENLDKSLHAVYHYKRFLELTPNSSEAANVRKWHDAALRKFYYKTRLEYNDPEDVGSLQNNLFMTEEELKKCKIKLIKLESTKKKLIQYARKTRNEAKILKIKLSSLEAVHQKTLDELKEKSAPEENKKEEKKEEEKIIKAEPKPESKPEIKKEEKVKPVLVIPKATATAPAFIIKKTDQEENIKNKEEEKEKINPKIRIYTVKRGDSLSSISRQFYGTPKYYKLIFEANQATLPSEKKLRPGQVLKIPPLQALHL